MSKVLSNILLHLYSVFLGKNDINSISFLKYYNYIFKSLKSCNYLGGYFCLLPIFLK